MGLWQSRALWEFVACAHLIGGETDREEKEREREEVIGLSIAFKGIPLWPEFHQWGPGLEALLQLNDID